MRIAAIALLLCLARTPAFGQAEAEAPDHSAYVEANRPRIEPRKLTSAETGAMRAAMSALRKNATEANLLALKPYADTGDAAAMRAMMDGYNLLFERLPGQDQMQLKSAAKTRSLRWLPMTPTRYEDRYAPLAGLWGMAIYRQSLPADLEVIRTLKHCIAEKFVGGDYYRAEAEYSGKRKTFDCGFSTFATTQALSSLSDMRKVMESRRKMKIEGVPIRFVERPVLSQAELDKIRFDQSLRSLRGEQNDAYFSDQILKEDEVWAKGYAYRHPDQFERWVDAQFRRDVDLSRISGKEMAPGTDVWLYMMASPNRQTFYYTQLSAHGTDRELRRKRFMDTLAGTANASQSELAKIAMSEGGTYAAEYWKRYGASTALGISSFAMCNVGVEAACAQARQEVAALNAPAAASAPGSSGGLYSQTDLNAQLDAFKAREAAINRGNCARASLGASIICN